VIRTLAPWFLALMLASGGVLVGWGADRYAWSAVLLHAEPVVLVFAAWAVAWAALAGRRALAFGLAAGAAFGFLGVRIPYEDAAPPTAPPDWLAPVQRCVNALNAPAAGLRVLQWTLDGVTAREDVVAAAETARADVVVLHHLADASIAEAVADALGGEQRFHPPEGGGDGMAIIASGGFHPCGEATEWSEAMDTPYGYSLAFVGVPPDTVFPLLVTRLPGPLESGAWAERMSTATGRVASVLEGLQAASMVVAADAPAPRTYRHLDGRMAALGLSTVPVPPNWPARWGSFPLLTLHPYDRAWVGWAWRVDAARRVDASVGLRAPVLTVLSPREVHAAL
jgi:hypothetical protein